MLRMAPLPADSTVLRCHRSRDASRKGANAASDSSIFCHFACNKLILSRHNVWDSDSTDSVLLTDACVLSGSRSDASNACHHVHDARCMEVGACENSWKLVMIDLTRWGSNVSANYNGTMIMASTGDLKGMLIDGEVLLKRSVYEG